MVKYIHQYGKAEKQNLATSEWETESEASSSETNNEVSTTSDSSESESDTEFFVKTCVIRDLPDRVTVTQRNEAQETGTLCTL